MPHHKVVGLQVLVPSAILAIVFVAAARAEDTDAAVSKQALQAKIEYCEVCHGRIGARFSRLLSDPRLAGQQPEYIKNQLQAFIERRRVNPIMFSVAHVLSPAMLTALAAGFQALNPKPLGGAPEGPRDAGKKIYEEGVANTRCSALRVLSRPGGEGRRAVSRLAGQLNDYIFNKLTNWSKERGQNPANPDTSAIMEPIAHGLTEPQIKAVAAYLGYLE